MPDATRTIWSRDSIASTACVIQGERLLTNHITVDDTLLVIVRQGQKSIDWHGHSILLSAGDAVLVGSGCAFDVTNIPPSSTAPFEAEWLSFPSLKLSDTGGKKDSLMPRALRDVTPFFLQAFCHTVAAIRDATHIPETVARKRMEEMSEWLVSFGLVLMPVEKEMLSQRIRRLVVTDLPRNWTASEVARHFAMSEATFRRRLSTEHTSFRYLVTEARMGHALTLLQVTDQTISQIASGVGYENPSKFSARFRARFGFNPGKIRVQETVCDPVSLV
ncbi:TPA: helix-turn-helix transcriptional regulator [Klebsiella aerogenes]|uniref:helix-turn-helix transcriptional regulator n=1 Tax=Klebsiella aerogenes TaxID=548 RepID=UPI00276E4693|nr:helix-turn-helix transcriptional regulator [Klebsiella aerogenes]HDS6533899.1 helix-turn-helix transcriptional regulator [Klebsiella aerogenes]HDS7500294.1 helix-turn-helix transcriptional regulator [Klebsiella aerogenes]HDS9641951.1 helix-turn-helix transcriptional regulator [Klebsiella aerogenes]HDT0787990.1 helix-turn-helix transcriptional regulator [Klebsiella aerogenes]